MLNLPGLNVVKGGPPKDIGAVIRRLYPVADRKVIGYRLSTLAKLAGNMPEM